MKFILIIMCFIACHQLNAQDSTRSQRHVQLQQLLGMSKGQYKTFRDGLKEFDKKITPLVKDEKLDKNAKGTAMNKVLSERRAYIEQNLTEEQRKRLHEFNKQHLPVSPRQKEQQKVEERLKKKGIKVFSQPAN